MIEQLGVCGRPMVAPTLKNKRFNPFKAAPACGGGGTPPKRRDGGQTFPTAPTYQLHRRGGPVCPPFPRRKRRGSDSRKGCHYIKQPTSPTNPLFLITYYLLLIPLISQLPNSLFLITYYFNLPITKFLIPYSLFL